MMNSKPKANLQNLFESAIDTLENQPRLFGISAEEIKIEPDAEGFYEIFIPYKIMLIKEKDNIQDYGISGTISIKEDILGFMFLRSYEDKQMSLYLKEDEDVTINKAIILDLTENEITTEGVKNTEQFYYGKTLDKELKTIADNIHTYPHRATVSYSLKNNTLQTNKAKA
ncbi:MAG: hypothetical protein KAR51_00705 [Candidatus Aenigmarchaeota archaeon]|nr:hypothetical protein [Candidatus Aenigmarchaeota archaeon]